MPKNHKVRRAREARAKLDSSPPAQTLAKSPLEARADKDAALAELYREVARCARKIQELLDIVIEQERS
jgi:hypothetical protein